MEKLIYLLGETEPETIPAGREDLRERIFEASSGLLEAGARALTASVADVDDPNLARIAQFNRNGLLDAQLSIWVDHVDARSEIEEIVSALVPRHAGYLVTESILREYPTLSRKESSCSASPGIALVTTFTKPESINDETFFARWHGSHGPLSLELHPLTRYVRNAIFRPVTENAPPLRAIVSESVTSCAIAADVEQFYGGRANRKRVIADLLSFAEIETLSTVVMREYILEI